MVSRLELVRHSAFEVIGHASDQRRRAIRVLGFFGLFLAHSSRFFQALAEVLRETVVEIWSVSIYVWGEVAWC